MNGKIAWITGATAGFGAATVERFVAGGWRVIASGRRADRLQQLVDRHGAERVHAAAFDMRDEAAMRAAHAALPAPFAAIDLLAEDHGPLQKLRDNALYFRKGMSALGFDLVPGEHAIIPVMLYDAKLAKAMADKLLAEGLYVIAFSYPVVPQGKARIRTQMSAAHDRKHLDRAIAAFEKVGKELGVIK